ncbi:uncharacterized protein [Aegilops tauschii subsp. strangulata]|uniref:uncharacterized protein n=1 Tax=Aegilops tauschii subsp. strangulata TaxID=200361 RepID=UPI003CC888BA
MDPSVSAFLTKLEAKIEASMDAQTKAQQATSAKIDEVLKWRPDLERRVADLSDAVAALQLAQPTAPKEGEEPPSMQDPQQQPPATHGIHTRPVLGATTHQRGPDGHDVFNIARGPSAVSFQTPPTLPASAFWVPMAALNFSGTASVWLQTIQKRLSEFDWDAFTSLLCARFGRDRHQMLIRQFYSLRQTTSVADYIEKFEMIINRLSSYSDSIHPYYFLTRFVEGLRTDIRAVVLVQRPPDLDTACSLALLQEEVLGGTFGALPRPPDVATKTAVPLPLPPPPSRPAPAAGATDRRGTDAARVESTKLKALRDYRRARGLCFKCGEKWGHDHICPTSVQLHVVEELLDVFGIDNTIDMQLPPEDTVMAISLSAVSGGISAKAFQLRAWIQGREVLMLVDSGSTNSFINQELAANLSGARPLPRACRVRVADGGELLCSAVVPACEWCTQGHDFRTDLKVLALGTYDAILGMDWLEHHSPMTVDWRAKLLEFQSPLGTVKLQGHDSELSTCLLINAVQLQSLCKNKAVSHIVHLCPISEDQTEGQHIPECLQPILDDFVDVFGEPEGLPPKRSCDHKIQLLPGAQPFSIKAYRHKPEQKDEIERQVVELLKSGVIQASNSPFSSPVILVKKKDGTWRMCGLQTTQRSHMCGYHQIRIAEGDEFKTVFQTHFGQFEFKVLSFGLAGGPATFNGAVYTTLKPVNRKCVLMFFDDILIFSHTLDEHKEHLRQVLALLRKDQWKVKLSKCAFGQQQLVYLGHVISSKGVATEPSKVKAVVEWPTPINVKEVRGFLGLAGYYRRFIRHFGMLARPMFNLLKKGVPFVWTSIIEQAFQALKNQLITAPVLALPDFSQQFVIETDASDKGVGAVLQQRGHPIAFMSKALCPRYQGLSAYEKEYLAILVAVDQWRPYLQHAEFLILTDQRSLVHLEEQRLTTPWQQKAFTKLLGLRYCIKYKKGSDNSAADALSRARPQEMLSAITSCQPAGLEDVVNSYNANPHAQKLLEQLSIRPDPKKRFRLHQGVLRFRDRIWLGGSTALQQRIISAFHDSTLGGHSGFPVTYRRVRRLRENTTACGFWWIRGLALLTFLPLAHPYTAATVAQLYMSQIYKLHGFPGAIISDRDPVFTSHFWRELFRYAGTELRMSTSNHPQTDRQTERVNQCLETFLRCFTHACLRRWSFWVPLAQFWYNTSSHSAIGMSPFKALYGYEPRHWGLTAETTVSVPSLQSWLEERRVIQDLIQQHLNRARQCMKHQADKKRSVRMFQVGDQVYLKLQPYIQTFVAPHANHKLSFKFYGPFTIIRKINDVAYELQLPASSTVHPVFHVSQLRQALLPGTVVTPMLPVCTDDLAVPVEILQTRWCKRRGEVVEQVQFFRGRTWGVSAGGFVSPASFFWLLGAIRPSQHRRPIHYVPPSVCSIIASTTTSNGVGSSSGRAIDRHSPRLCDPHRSSTSKPPRPITSTSSTKDSASSGYSKQQHGHGSKKKKKSTTAAAGTSEKRLVSPATSSRFLNSSRLQSDDLDVLALPPPPPPPFIDVFPSGEGKPPSFIDVFPGDASLPLSFAKIAERPAPCVGMLKAAGRSRVMSQCESGMSSSGDGRSSSKRPNQLGSSSSLILPARSIAAADSSSAAADSSSAAATRSGQGVGVPRGRV